MDSICPHLGLQDDPKTSALFPTHCHKCYRTKPAQPVALEHQRDFCLSEKCSECQGFIIGWRKGFPKRLLNKKRKKFNPRKFLTAAGIGLGIGLLGGLVFLIRSIKPAPIATLQGGIVSVSATATVQDLTVTHTPDISTITPSPSQTPAPALTTTFTPGPEMMTPFGEAGLQFLIYEVAAGDSLQLIADRYDTSTEVLTAVNTQDSLLWVGDIIVVCVGCDETQDLPQLTARYLDAGITLTELAEECDCPIEDLRRWNSLGEGDWIPEGRWIVVPDL